MSGRSGRKRRLTEDEGRRLSEMYLYGQALAAEAARFSPKALAVQFGVAPATIYDYVEKRHKGEAGYEKPRQGIRAVLAALDAADAAVTQALRNLEAEVGVPLLANTP